MPSWNRERSCCCYPRLLCVHLPSKKQVFIFGVGTKQFVRPATHLLLPPSEQPNSKKPPRKPGLLPEWTNHPHTASQLLKLLLAAGCWLLLNGDIVLTEVYSTGRRHLVVYLYHCTAAGLGTSKLLGSNSCPGVSWGPGIMTVCKRRGKIKINT